jgi:Zn finger protein HypA/HybF involved in hydrogenase expression
VLFGRVMSFAKLDPDFVCRNCQGVSADESIVALCSNCGALQPQAVLKACRECKYDFRSSFPRERMWSDREDGITRPPLGTAAKWLPDPTGRHELRYWNGHNWTPHVADDGHATTDALKDLPANLAAGRCPSATTTRQKRQADKEATARGLIRCQHCGQRNQMPAAATGMPRCGKCHQPLPWITNADDTSFVDTADAAKVPVIVDL